MAPSLGYQQTEARPVRAPQDALPAPPRGATPSPSAKSPASGAGIPTGGGLRFWRHLGGQLSEAQGDGQRPYWARDLGSLTQADVEVRGDRPPSPPRLPLSPWSRLWPFLYRVLGRTRSGGELDLARVVESMARGRTLHRLPLRRRSAWAPGCQVLIERASRLTPFREEFDQLCRDLIRLRGGLGLELLVFEHGPNGGCRTWGKPGTGSRPYKPPAPGTPLLVLSDLGCLQAAPDPVRDWLLLGRRLAAAGLEPVVLMPSPRRWWRAELGRWFRPVTWDRGRGLPRRLPSTPPGGEPPMAREAGAEALLTLLAPALSVEPDLLRAMRSLVELAFPEGTTAPDIGSEAAAWQHPDMFDSVLALSYRPEVQADYRERFRRLDVACRRQAVALISHHHRHRPLAVRFEEALVAAELCGLDADQAQAFMRRVLGSLLAPDDFPQLAGLQAWLRRLGRRTHRGLGDLSPALEAAWVKANEQALVKNARVTTPLGFDTSRSAWVLDGEPPSSQLFLYQLGNSLVAVEPTEPMSAILAVARLDFAHPQVQVTGDGWAGQSLLLEAGTRIEAPTTGRTLTLSTDRQRLDLVSMERPDWARVMGRDQLGLFAIDHQGQRRELGLLEQTHSKPDWADEAGEDEYGRWAEVRIEDIPLRMRWIELGSFWMGSSEDEPERDSEETRHWVTLSQGYWLAETTVTQALWQAVMGSNPSRFKGPQRPVEQVSWDDCQGFIERTEALCLGLTLRLPSEAEWEQACRAGSETPFWFGDNITPEQVNYDGTQPYTDGKEGLFRQATVEVTALPCNNWGLYQMHGNVWEWCQDWFGDPPAEPVTVPAGPGSGVDRVLRGGGWIDSAWRARSASRVWGLAASANAFSGLRLARGQGPAKQGREPGLDRTTQKSPVLAVTTGYIP